MLFLERRNGNDDVPFGERALEDTARIFADPSLRDEPGGKSLEDGPNLVRIYHLRNRKVRTA
jgi:hypothetical protein